MESIDRRLLYQQFQEAFPIEYLKEMPLDKYTNLNRADSFCYWLESETYKLGSIWGGSSYKFGIYKYNKRPNEADSRIQSDDNYAWYAKYNKGTAEEAYLLVRDAVVSIAEYARNGDLESIDEINTLGDTFKWKIAFLYSNESLIPIYNKDMLNIVSEELGMNDPKGKSIPFIQRFLMQKKGDTDLYVFYDSILSIWEAHKAPNTFKAVKEKVIEKLNADSRFRAYPGGKVYLWIGTADGHINNSDCHYELCADGNPKASHERGKVFVELHCEGKDVNQYKCLAEIDGVHSFPWKKFAIRANDEGWVISDYTTEELADILIDELYRLDDLVGEKVRSISDTEPSEKRYWLYAPGENASKWQECQDKGIICIGWDDLGDVSQYETIDEIQSKLQEVNQNPEGSFKNDRLALWDFCRVMKPGDIVYAKQGMSKIIGRGIVTGEYVFDDSRANYKSYRQVEWTHIGC